MPPLTNFSDSFNNPDHADVLLHISTSLEVCVGSEPSAADDAACSSIRSVGMSQRQYGTPAGTVRSYHLHSLMLVSQSKYFQGRLAKTWPQSDSRKRRRGEVDSSVAAVAEDAVQETGSGSGSSSLKEVTELVEEAELEAMHELLTLMYKQEVPSEATTELTLTCLQLADRYQAAHCTQLLLAHLAVKGKEAITYTTAVQLFSMPPGLQEQAVFQDLLQTCKEEHLLGRFRNVPEVIQNDELMQQFCALPFAAVLAWAESDQLQVHSENCVVYLLSAWVAAMDKQQGGQRVGPEQLEQLAHQVRALHLGPAYQFFVLPSLDWFKSCSGMPHLPMLLAHKGVNDSRVPVFPAPGRGQQNKPSWAWGGPAAWVAGPRQRITAVQEGSTSALSWEMGPSELKQLSDGETVVSPSSLYSNGFQLKMHCQLQGAEQSLTLGLYYHVCYPVMSQHGVHFTSPASVSVSELTFQINAPSAADRHAYLIVYTRSTIRGFGLGTANALKRSAPTLQELVAPLLINGKLQVEMEVSGVDLPVQ